MLEEYLIHIASDMVLVSCAATMSILFLVDLYGIIAKYVKFTTTRHIDFKSTIVSIGIFGTFLGILSGLYGFDSADITKSVPLLLEGLKLAFATSVLGMALSLILAVLQKFTGGADDDTEILASIDSKIGQMTKRLTTLVNTLESPTELIKQFNDLKSFLQYQLEQINASLDKALVELAAGATEEVIQALEKVILEFNTNLQEQFGDNFKQLNEACLKLLEWQKRYREHVDNAEKHLNQIRDSLDVAAKGATALVDKHQETKDICREVGGLIKTYDVQVKTLGTHLESCKRLGEEAKEFLTTTEKALTQSSENLNSFSGIIEKSVSKQSEALAGLTENIEKQLPEALGELEDVLTKITNQFATDYRSLFEFISDKR